MKFNLYVDDGHGESAVASAWSLEDMLKAIQEEIAEGQPSVKEALTARASQGATESREK